MACLLTAPSSYFGPQDFVRHSDQNQSLADSNFWESSDEGTLFKNRSIKNGEKKNVNKHKNKEGIDKNDCDDNDRDDDRNDDNNDGDCGIWALPRFTWISCDETKAPSSP